MMDAVVVQYHREGPTWWAESDQLPGFSALASSFLDTRRMVQDHLLHEQLDVSEVIEMLDGVRLLATENIDPRVGRWGTIAEVGKLASATGRARFDQHVVQADLVEA